MPNPQQQNQNGQNNQFANAVMGTSAGQPANPLTTAAAAGAMQ